MLLFGLGLFDAGYLAQMQYKQYSLTHEIVKYKDETYSRDSLGVQYSKPLSRWVSGVAVARAGYEHHYDSKLYGKAYLFGVPEIGIQSRHDYVAVKILWSPFKYFYKVSDDSKYAKQSFRVQPSVSFTVSLNLEHSLWIPNSVNKESQNDNPKNLPTRLPRSTRSDSLRTPGIGKPAPSVPARSE